MPYKKRFTIRRHSMGLSTGATILVDRETRVQYLFYQSGYGGGMTVLVDRDGKPLLASSIEE